MKTIAALGVIGVSGLVFTACCCDWNPCSDSDPSSCQPEACYMSRPVCCPQPHVWDRQGGDPTNYH